MLAKNEGNYNPPDTDASVDPLRNSVAVVEDFIDLSFAWLGAAFYVLFSAKQPQFELAVFETSGETLSKVITLGADGQPVSDSSHCRMRRGKAWRYQSRNLSAFAKYIESMPHNRAIAIGRLKAGLQPCVEVYKQNNSHSRARGCIARTQDNLEFSAGRPALVLFDVDTKGITDDVCDRVAEAGGYWNALVAVCSALGKAAHVIRASTTAGLVNTATGGAYEGSGGLHIYTLIQDGADTPRFIETLANRLWLAGYGWILISKAGSLLQRTIIDVAVSSPERLVFEGGPTLREGLRQDKEARRARVYDGECLNTVGACHDLTVGEEARLGAMIAQAKAQKHGEFSAHPRDMGGAHRRRDRPAYRPPRT